MTLQVQPEMSASPGGTDEHKRRAVLRGLGELMHTVTATLERDTVLSTIVRTVAESLDMPLCLLFLVDEQGGLHRRAAYGIPSSGDSEVAAVKARQGAEETWSTGKASIKEPDGAMYAPLRIHGKIIGVLCVLHNDEEERGSKTAKSARPALTATDLAMLTTFAGQAAVALEVSRLYEQGRELAVTEERNRLAREIHDTLAQSLTTIVMQLATAETLLNEDKAQARREIQEARELARVSLEEARRSVLSLQPSPLAHRSLADALAQELNRAAEQANASSHFRTSGEEREIAPEVAAALFRIAQEALSNIRKYAHARRIYMVLTYTPALVTLQIEDDGIGFDVTSPPQSRFGGGFGLTSMRERARLLGGDLEIQSAPGKGTQIVATLPYTPRRSTSLATLALASRTNDDDGDGQGGSQFERRPTGEDPQAALALSRQQGASLRSRAALPGLPSILQTSPPGPAPLAEHKGAIRVLIVDDHALARQGIRRMLEGRAEIQVVGEAVDGLDALAMVQELHPQVVLMDMQMPQMNGAEATEHIHTADPEIRIIILTTFDSDEYVLQGLKAGARGYLLKDVAPDELVRAIYTVQRGDALMQPGVTNKLLHQFERLHQPRPPLLTPRELEVLQLLATGARNKEMAAKLSIGERTVKFHITNIVQKLGATSRIEAITKARTQGLLK